MTIEGLTLHLSVWLGKVDFYPPIHLALDELELGDLFFRLPVGPGLGDGGTHGCCISCDSQCKGGNQAGACIYDPRIKFGFDLLTDHGVKPFDECTGINKCGHLRLYGSNSNSISFAQMIAVVIMRRAIVRADGTL